MVPNDVRRNRDIKIKHKEGEKKKGVGPQKANQKEEKLCYRIKAFIGQCGMRCENTRRGDGFSESEKETKKCKVLGHSACERKEVGLCDHSRKRYNEETKINVIYVIYVR